MLSCRVQGKFIEQALFWRLADEAKAAAVIVNFRPTERNRAAEMVLEKLGFETGPDGRRSRRLTADELAVDFLTIEA
jgi:predicted enzyme involved in methoxymalonyl-ACP biosynthesis